MKFEITDDVLPIIAGILAIVACTWWISSCEIESYQLEKFKINHAAESKAAK